MFTLAQSTEPAQMDVVAAVLFYGFAALTVVSAWAIVISQNIVRMAVYLLLTLAGAAGMYFMLSAEFLAAVQLIVYAGGTLILIIFGIMLTSRNPFMQLKAPLVERVLGISVVSVIAGKLVFAAVRSPIRMRGPLPGDPDIGYGQVEAIGVALLSDYLVPFEIAAVLLLVVMIGAAFMARKRGER